MKHKILKDEIIYNGKFIEVKKRHFLGQGKKPGIWEIVKRKTYGKIISIAAITENNELILEKIFRIPLNDYVIELPAGLMDEKDESEEECVKRELLEETGYKVDKVNLLTSGPFNTGLTSDEMAIYLGKQAELIQKPELDLEEDIEVIKVSLKNLPDYLLNSKIKVDLKIWAVMYFIL